MMKIHVTYIFVYVHTDKPLYFHPKTGSGERVEQDGSPYYCLVLSYCPMGRLSTYLSENTISWPQFCHIVLSATRGLAHLHSDIRKGGKEKDENDYKNFLIRSYFTAVTLIIIFSISHQY